MNALLSPYFEIGIGVLALLLLPIFRWALKENCKTWGIPYTRTSEIIGTLIGVVIALLFIIYGTRDLLR